MPKSSKNPRTLFGTNLAAEQFLARHWQKKPLLVRGAMPDFKNPIEREHLFALAANDGVESRLISRRGKLWQLEHGPFDERYFSTQRLKNWTLLVQDVQHHVAAAWQLLAQFNFIPYARLDDLMVSYAVDGGGVGPHYDSYDVFLIQAHGRRRWRIAKQFERTARANTPVKIIPPFNTEQEWLLEPGDMLYLPPDYAHEGVADGECITFSVGFRAPRADELALAYLQELAAARGFGALLEDADLAPTARPASLDSALISRYRAMVEHLDWRTKDFAKFLGIYLSEPKPQTEFDAPAQPLREDAFAKRAGAFGLSLSGKTRMLYRGKDFFVNGQHAVVPAADRKALAQLADSRAISARSWQRAAMTMLYEWYCDGFLVPGDASRKA